MVELDKPIPTQKVRHVGIFDFKETYRFCYMWFLNEQYDIVEKNYTEKITPRGKEIEIEWDAVRKISDYFRFQIQTKWRVVGLNDVEVEYEGKKVKMDKGDCEIRFTAVLQKDYESRWEDTPILKWLRTLYDKYLIQARIDKYEAKLVEELNDLLAQTKAYMALSVK
jgi:hypothetical protein